jgi:hypothetical protein
MDVGSTGHPLWERPIYLPNTLEIYLWMQVYGCRVHWPPVVGESSAGEREAGTLVRAGLLLQMSAK